MSVERRTVGMTLPREQFSVQIAEAAATRHEYLTGFASQRSAEQAARRRIDFIVDIHDPHATRAHSRQSSRRRAGRH